MNEKIRRGLGRLILHTSRFLLIPIELLNSRAYMHVYLVLLRRMGLVLNGTPRYIASDTKFDDMGITEIGDRVVISKRVILLTHDYSLTTALIAINQAPRGGDLAIRKPIKIGNNVFVGMGAILLPGTEIGDDVIIGAGSVVRGKVPAGVIVVGNPAEVVGSIADRRERWLRMARHDDTSQDRN